MTTFQIVLVGAAGIAVGQTSVWTIRRFGRQPNPRLVAPMVASGWSIAAVMGVAVITYPLILWCAVLAGIDMGSRRLPNVLTGAGATAVVLYGAAVHRIGTVLTGSLALFLCYLVVHLLLPAAFGAGDVKLAFTTGGVAALTGMDAWATAALLAPLLTGLLGLVWTVFSRGRPAVPHGPSMCLTTLLAVAAVPT